MKVELMALVQGIAESRDVWKAVWQVSLSVAALSFLGLGWLLGRGILVHRNPVREPWLPVVVAALCVSGAVAFVLGLVAAIVSTNFA